MLAIVAAVGFFLSEPTFLPLVKPPDNPSRNIFHAGTVGIVAAALFSVGVVLFFQYAPNALRWPVRVLWLISLGWLVAAAVRTLMSTRFTGRKITFILILGAFYYLVLSVACHVFIKLMSQRDDRLTTRGMTSLAPDCKLGINALIDESGFSIFSPQIGWLPRPNYRNPSYTVNAQGLRATREYAETPADPGRRILCLGDSYTFGIAVTDEQAYPAHAERLRPGTEWINLGNPGSCLTQSYFRYRQDGKKFGGKHVVIGFMTNDAQRTVNCFRPFVNVDSGFPYTKPYARFSDGIFSLEPNPYQDISDFKRLLADERVELDKLRRLDYLAWSRQGGSSGPILRTVNYVCEVMRVDRNFDSLLDLRLPLSGLIRRVLPVDPYGRDIWRPTGPGFKALTGLFDQYYNEIIADGRIPLIVILPGPLDVDDYRNQFGCQYAPLLKHFKAKNYRYFDFLDPLVARHKGDLSTDSLFIRSHYQGHINEELAGEIIKALRIP